MRPNLSVTVALTLLVIKSFDKIVREVLLCVVQAAPDPLPFAYRSGSGVDQHLAEHNLVTLEQCEDISVTTFLWLFFGFL